MIYINIYADQYREHSHFSLTSCLLGSGTVTNVTSLVIFDS